MHLPFSKLADLVVLTFDARMTVAVAVAVVVAVAAVVAVTVAVAAAAAVAASAAGPYSFRTYLFVSLHR